MNYNHSLVREVRMEREKIQREITRFLQKSGIPIAGVSAHYQIHPNVAKAFSAFKTLG